MGQRGHSLYVLLALRWLVTQPPENSHREGQGECQEWGKERRKWSQGMKVIGFSRDLMLHSKRVRRLALGCDGSIEQHETQWHTVQDAVWNGEANITTRRGPVKDSWHSLQGRAVLFSDIVPSLLSWVLTCPLKEMTMMVELAFDSFFVRPLLVKIRSWQPWKILSVF